MKYPTYLAILLMGCQSPRDVRRLAGPPAETFAMPPVVEEPAIRKEDLRSTNYAPDTPKPLIPVQAGQEIPIRIR